MENNMDELLDLNKADETEDSTENEELVTEIEEESTDDVSENDKKKKRIKRIAIISSIVLVIIAGIICFAINRKSAKNKAVNEIQVVVERKDIQNTVSGSSVSGKVSRNEVKAITELESYSGYIDTLTHSTAKINNTTYALSDSVLFYRKDSSNNILRLTIDEAMNGNYNLKAYYDKPQSSGGRIRVIVAQNK